MIQGRRKVGSSQCKPRKIFPVEAFEPLGLGLSELTNFGPAPSPRRPELNPRLPHWFEQGDFSVLHL